MIAKSRRLSLAKAVIGTTMLAGALAGCAKNKGELVVEDGVGVTALRTACPIVEIPEMTGDVTLFTDPSRTDRRRSTWSPRSPTCVPPATTLPIR
ncbi:hypothetical protein ACFS32_06640 [Novosphingobium pokkalii]|uniref:hypothetical protein n=1 Tax=Novosphingobium pokkalii TaxID=1770194 RepID=UPI003633BD14